jgi:hypothetical protein
MPRDPRHLFCEDITVRNAARPAGSRPDQDRWDTDHAKTGQKNTLTTGHRMERENSTMYDMYPEWGPAAHDEDHPAHSSHWATPVQESMDLRDNGGERPDDN